GGCHYAADCRKFESGCGACPQLGSSAPRDLSWRSARAKEKLWHLQRRVAVCPSRWMAESARRSSALRGLPVEVIPNGIDTVRFSPGNRAAARSRLGLPLNKTIILTGAADVTTDGRKGFDRLISALQQIPKNEA